MDQPLDLRRCRSGYVVDQVGKQCHGAREDEDRGLDKRRGAQHSEAERDGFEARARAHNRTVDEPVGVPVLAVMVMFVLMLVPLNRL
jgi:hypothetical protein